jgi:hypothetical protein
MQIWRRKEGEVFWEELFSEKAPLISNVTITNDVVEDFEEIAQQGMAQKAAVIACETRLDRRRAMMPFVPEDTEVRIIKHEALPPGCDIETREGSILFLFRFTKPDLLYPECATQVIFLAATDLSTATLEKALQRLRTFPDVSLSQAAQQNIDKFEQEGPAQERLMRQFVRGIELWEEHGFVDHSTSDIDIACLTHPDLPPNSGIVRIRSRYGELYATWRERPHPRFKGGVTRLIQGIVKVVDASVIRECLKE